MCSVEPYHCGKTSSLVAIGINEGLRVWMLWIIHSFYVNYQDLRSPSDVGGGPFRNNQ